VADVWQKMVKRPLTKILSKYLSFKLKEIWTIGHTIDCIYDKDSVDSHLENQMVKIGVNCLWYSKFWIKTKRSGGNHNICNSCLNLLLTDLSLVKREGKELRLLKFFGLFTNVLCRK